jgi:N-succinyldiaminopimelate aminotransferase
MPRYPALSGAANGLSARVYTALSELARQNAPEVFSLNVGDTHLEPPVCARAEAQTVERTPLLHTYAAVQGEPALLDAIVAQHAARGRELPRSAIQVTVGATSGLDLACRALLSPGDEVIVLAPFWPLIRGIVSATGAVPIELPFFTQLRGDEFDIGRALEGVVSPRTVAIYVNHPHNPTGVVLRDDELNTIAGFAREHNLWVLSDEAYEELWYEAPGHHHGGVPGSSGATPPGALWLHPDVRERAIVAHTFSKTYGICGARVGYVHGSEAAMSAIQALETFVTYCAPRPLQIAAARALTEPEGAAWVENARAVYKQAAQAAADAVGVPVPASGTFLFFALTPFLRDAESPQQLLERCAKAGVVLTPGSAAGKHYPDWARMCFTCVDPATLERALGALKTVLADR